MGVICKEKPMNHYKIYYPIKVFSVLSFIAIAFKYWNAGAVGLSLLLSPYVVIYFLANDNNYRNLKLTLIRAIPAVATFLLVPWLLFCIESDPQAGIGLIFGVVIQLAFISTAELIILFFLNGESRK